MEKITAADQKKQPTRTPTDDGEDQISTLPDEIIHDILLRLQSHEQAWQAAVLSKRWAQLLRSYPILEFEEELYKGTELWESVGRFAKSRVENFSRQQGNMISLNAIRVKVVHCSEFYSELHDRILELAARCNSLREIDVDFGCGPSLTPGFWDYFYISYRIPKRFFIPSQPNSKQFLRLKVLKLSYCNFHEYEGLEETSNNPFSGLGSSLKELCLENVTFGYSFWGSGDWILNGMIAGATLLEKLTLTEIEIRRFQIRDHRNLKSMEMTEFCVNGFEIASAQSLERVDMISTYFNCEDDDVQISFTPNFKLLYFGGYRTLSEKVIEKLKVQLPSLEVIDDSWECGERMLQSPPRSCG